LKVSLRSRKGTRFATFFRRKWRKELEWGVLEGACVVVIPASFVVWYVCEGRDITDGSFVKMRGRNTRTARYRVFLFVVKTEIYAFALATNQTNGIYLCL
jgi:hypothetical protein